MLTTLNKMFCEPKPYKINFIQENKRKVKERSMVNQNNNRSRLEMTKSANSQIEIGGSLSSSSHFKDRNVSSSRSKLSAKGSMAVFVHEKKDRGSISNVSITGMRKSSHRGILMKNQSCQTIDPRRCDQLFHEGVIKYPSNKILQELAEVEKQKANRLDAHVKKEFFRRNKVKHKSPKKMQLYKPVMKVTEKGDEGEGGEGGGGGGEENPSEEEELEEEDESKLEEEDEEECEKPEEKTGSPVTTTNPKASPPPLTMCAAEIIRKTTENINTQRRKIQSDHVPNSKGDSKSVKKLQKHTKDEEIMKTVSDPHCPPGHIPLPDVERKKTLHMLRVSHAELVREMNLLPVRTDTLRVRQRKMQLETQLNKIEEGIKVFNKSKVYVKIEE